MTQNLIKIFLVLIDKEPNIREFFQILFYLTMLPYFYIKMFTKSVGYIYNKFVTKIFMVIKKSDDKGHFYPTNSA